MKKLVNIIYILVFMIILLVPVSLTETEVGKVSDLDNRKLVDFPSFVLPGFTDNLESYLRDRIGLRRQIICAYAYLNDKLAKELTHPSYVYGTDGNIFFNMHDNIQFGDYHKSFAEMVFKMQEYCEMRGTNFYFMIEPEKISTMREHHPYGVNYDDSWVQDMLHYMDELGIHYVDNVALLDKVSENEDVFNKKYDVGHWNDLGCYYGTNNLFKRIKDDFPEAKSLSMDDFKISTMIEKKLVNSDFIINEEVPKFEAKDNYEDVTKQYLDEIIVNNAYRQFHYYINEAEDASKLPKMMVFQGSYYNGRPQFLFNGSSSLIGIHNYQNVLALPYYYNIFQPDIVVFEVAEYTLSDVYFDSAAMKTIKWNPTITINNSDITKYEQTNIDCNVKCIEGDEIDYLYVDKAIKNADYAYLVLGDMIYDLEKKQNCYISLLSDNVAIGDTATIVVKKNSGETEAITTTIARGEEIEHSFALSENTASVTKGTTKYIINTNKKNNYFNEVNLQLRDRTSGEVLEILDSTRGGYDIKGSFTLNSNSGEYLLRLNANSNLQDEYIDYIVYLEKGETYGYTFHVEKLSEKEVVITNYNVIQ